MIVKTGAALRGARTYGLIAYLMGPGRANEHTDQRVIAGFAPPETLQPPARNEGRTRFDVRGLVAALDRPLADATAAVPVKHVFHTVIANRADDPVLSDEQWADIAYDMMRELGLAGTEQSRRDIRWVAIRHDPTHIHLAGTLVRADGTIARTPNDFKAAALVRARMEAKYGLTRTNSGDRTASIRPQRAEAEKAARQQRAETERETVRRLVRAAAGIARSPEEFRSELVSFGVRFQPRYSTQHPGEVTGYKVALLPQRSDSPATVWFAGGGLDRDLTWPKLAARWAPAVRPEPEPIAASSRPAPLSAEQLAGMDVRDRLRAEAAVGAAEVAGRVAAIRLATVRAAAAESALHADPRLVDTLAPAAADLAAVTAHAWQRHPDGRTPITAVTAAADGAQRAGRTPGGAAPAYSGRSTLLRTAVRGMALAGQLSSDADTAAWVLLAVQVAAMLDAVADARVAQQRADQAAAARVAAARFRVEVDLVRSDPAAAGAPLGVRAAVRRTTPPPPPSRSVGLPPAGPRPGRPGPEPYRPPPAPPSPGRAR